MPDLRVRRIRRGGPLPISSRSACVRCGFQGVRDNPLSIIIFSNCWTIACEGCTVTLTEALRLFKKQENCIHFLQKHGVIKNECLCPTCDSACYLQTSTLLWRCQKTISIKKGKQKIKRKCNFKKSWRFKSWFAKSNLSPQSVCDFIAMYVLGNPPHQSYLKEEYKMSSESVNDWMNYIFVRRWVSSASLT